MLKAISHVRVERGETETLLRIPNHVFDSLNATDTVSVGYVEYDDHIRVWRAPLDGWTDSDGNPLAQLTDAEEEEESDLALFREMPNEFDNEEWVWETDEQSGEKT